MVNVTLPELGEGITTAEVVCWHAAEGQRVTPADDLVELVTDKAVFNVPAPVTGILRKVHVTSGNAAPIGAILAEIEPATEGRGA